MPSLQFQPTFSDRNLCFSEFSVLGHQHPVAGEIYEEGGETTKLNRNKSRAGPWIVQSQSQFAGPQTETQLVLRQLVAVCVLLSQAFCLEKKFRGRGLTYIPSSTLQCRLGNSMEQLEKLPGASFARLSPLLVEVWKEHKNTAVQFVLWGEGV